MPFSALTRYGRLTCLLLILALLAGCSSTRLSYQFADRGVVWWVEDFVELTGEQEDALRQDLRELRDWHCETQLPRYSDWLAQLRRETADGRLSPARIDWHREQAGRFLEPLAQRIVPVAGRLLTSLSDKQVEQLIASMKEQQAEYREEYLRDDTPEDAADRVRERAERWLGTLNDRQRVVIRQWVADREGATEAWLEGRENWQQAFARLLQTRQQPGFRDSLRDMIVNYQKYQGDSYPARAERNAGDVVRLTHDLLVAADDKHWQHLQEETIDLRQDVIALTCVAPVNNNGQ